MCLSAVCIGTDSDNDNETTTTTPPTTTIVPTTPSEHMYYSQLDITSVTSNNNKITIEGTTDLPSGSTLIVGVKLANLEPEDTWVGVDAHAEVSNGKFSVTMDTITNPAFAKGPYVASAFFTPKNQEQNVIDCVGENGEYLTGEHLLFGNWNMLEVEVTVDSLNLNIQTEYPMVKAINYPSHSAERALAEFLISWQNEDWERMASFTQKTWKHGEDDPNDIMWAWFGFMELQGVEINSVVHTSECVTDISFTMYYIIFNDVKSETRVARVICETEPYTPDPSGEWGVNPISILS